MKKILILFIMMIISVACGTKTVEIGNPDFTDNEAAGDVDAQDDSDIDEVFSDDDSVINPDNDSVIDPDEDAVIVPDDDSAVVPDDDTVTGCTIGEKKCDNTLDNVLECNVAHEWISVEDCSDPLKMCVENPVGTFYCDTLTCEPDTKFCKNEDVYTCNADGKTDVLSTNCTDLQYCDTTTVPVSCHDMICDPNELFCDSNVLKLCSSNGGGSTVSKDCGTGVCDGTLKDCVYTGDLGGTGNTARDTQKRGNFFNCTKNVKVVEFAQGFNLSANTDLTWAIYEAEGVSTTYKKIFSKTATVTSKGSALYSTGAISVDLKNGNKYLFVTAWTGSRIFIDGGTHPVEMGFGTSFAGHSGDNLTPNEMTNPAENIYVFKQNIKYILSE
ncbi:MAG TPA: hypothetical protein PKG52_02040 [bacterium]|nr:hypothetical protein [bacterium]HPS29095.1 hypothetical protein [bacterium]